MQGCNYASLAIRASGGTIYAAGSDGKLKALEDGGSVGLKVAADVEVSCTITQIALPVGKPKLHHSPQSRMESASSLRPCCAFQVVRTTVHIVRKESGL